jgi:molecular chaperone GrpE
LLLQGVAMVRDLFVSKLEGLGVARVEALGTRFDPRRHEALTVVPVEDPGSDGEVVSVIREGYRIGDDILRPAAVAVAQGPLPPGGLSGTSGPRDSQV